MTTKRSRADFLLPPSSLVPPQALGLPPCFQHVYSRWALHNFPSFMEISWVTRALCCPTGSFQLPDPRRPSSFLHFGANRFWPLSLWEQFLPLPPPRTFPNTFFSEGEFW